MIQVEVLRPIPAGDRRLKPGELVDATDWRNVDKLVQQRKVRYVTNRPGEEPEATPAPRPRKAPLRGPAEEQSHA